MKETILKAVRKTPNGYEDRNGVEVLCKSENVTDWLNANFGTQPNNDTEDVLEFFAGNPVLWRFDESENVYYSVWAADETLTGYAFKVIGVRGDKPKIKEIRIRYNKPAPFIPDYEEFLIHNVDSDGSWHLLKKESWGYSPVIKPNGTFEDENLARMVLAYIETNKGYTKDTEHEMIIAE